MADKSDKNNQVPKNPNSSTSGAKKDRKFGNNYQQKKRQPPREFRSQNDFYINNKTNFKGQLKECLDLLEAGVNEIYLHGLGSAVRRTINLALQIEEKFHPLYQLDVKTRTVKLVDDFEPLNEEDEYETQTRMNSAVKIKIFKPPIST